MGAAELQQISADTLLEKLKQNGASPLENDAVSSALDKNPIMNFINIHGDLNPPVSPSALLKTLLPEPSAMNAPPELSDKPQIKPITPGLG